MPTASKPQWNICAGWLRRALEIAEIVGDRPLPEPRGYTAPIAWLGLDVPRDAHARWIADRARAQFAAGLVDEARSLRERYDPTLPAFSAIGYAESWALLDGEIDRETAIERNMARNVAFAKRQRTWFRREPEIEWLDPTADALDPLALRVARRLIVARG
ncbi:MAG: tRNA delta(2)-isopentenylpyrophosphate transferase [Chloroflexi bacterium]|nr:tRNA delta(2)-isopentenylpyrophosphate transferase [Chloroflexota bacterium]